jgi:DNA-directed RNA polymerase specialized sigma24 family protein
MKTRTRLALQQADMRSLLRKRGPRRRSLARATDLQRRVVATILVYERGYTPAQIALRFGWNMDDVEKWFLAGKPLL